MSDNESNTILVVEDDPFLRKSISFFLKENSYDVLEAANGKEALDSFDLNKPALILTDLSMPVMDGLQLLEEMATKSPDTPVIILSGAGAMPDVIDALREGAWDYITKPVPSLEFVLDRIERALIQSRMTKDYTELLDKAVKKKTADLEAVIRERQILENQLFHAKREWERTVDALPQLIALIDKKHQMVRVNKAMATMLGMTPEEAVGRTFDPVMFGQNAPPGTDPLITVFDDGQPQFGAFYHEGTDTYYDVNMVPYYDYDDINIVGLVYIAHHISDRASLGGA